MQVDFDLTEWPQLWRDDEHCLVRKADLAWPHLCWKGWILCSPDLTELWHDFFMQKLPFFVFTCSQKSQKVNGR